jgi:hypothetical protein
MKNIYSKDKNGSGVLYLKQKFLSKVKSKETIFKKP